MVRVINPAKLDPSPQKGSRLKMWAVVLFTLDTCTARCGNMQCAYARRLGQLFLG